MIFLMESIERAEYSDDWMTTVHVGEWIHESGWRERGLVKSWAEQARGWTGLSQTPLGVDRKVNRVIVGPWTKDGFNEKYWALVQELGDKWAGTSILWLFCFSAVLVQRDKARRQTIPCRSFCFYVPCDAELVHQPVGKSQDCHWILKSLW